MMTQEKVPMCEPGAGAGPVLACAPPVEYNCAQNKRLQQPAPVNQNGSTEHEAPCTLERDYYGCYCLKFIVKNGTHITEDKVMDDFGKYGEVVDVRGPGLFSGLRGNHVYVRFIDRHDAEEALKSLLTKYHQLTPASISDVLPDNYGLYTISFYNKTGIPSTEVRREFSKFGEVKNLTGSLDVKGGRVFVSYKNKNSAVEALQAFFFRKDRYPNMKFALPRCEKDYFGCYCLKFYNKSGDVTEEKVLEDFGQYGEVVDVRGPGLFDVTGDDVYVRYKEKSSAEQALIELVGKYDSLCLAPPSDIQADKFGYYTITFVNDKCLSKSDVWYIFSKFGTVACVNGTFDCKKGRVFVSYKEKQGALNALETMLITKEYHLQVSKNSTVRKNDYNIVTNPKENESLDFDPTNRHDRALSEHKTTRDRSCSREASSGPQGGHKMTGPPPPIPRPGPAQTIEIPTDNPTSLNHTGPPPMLGKYPMVMSPKNGLVKFNRNVEKDIFGYFCLSFLNEDGEISEKNVRHVFSKFGEVVSVRGALGKQKGHVFVRFRKKEAAENCLNCLNSFPLSEMSELFGRYLFLSPATPRDIDCDMYGLYSISFLNLNAKSFREIRQEFSKFGEIVRQTTGGGTNTDELVTISYNDKGAAVRALQTHFTNKDYPYLDIAKGSSLLLVNSSDSSDCEDHEGSILAAVRAGALHPHHQDLLQDSGRHLSRSHSADRHAGPPPHIGQHDPFSRAPAPPGSDVVDELLKPLQSYFSVFRTGQYTGGGLESEMVNGGPPAHNTRSQSDKRYKIKKHQENERRKRGGEMVENGHMPHGPHPGMAMVPGLPMSAPPPMSNGYGPHHGLEHGDMSHMPPPNMAEPPPNMVPGAGPPPHYPPPPHLQHPLLLPPPVLLSSSPGSPGSAPLYQSVQPAVTASSEPEADQVNDQTLDLDISKMSISELPTASEPTVAEIEMEVAEAPEASEQQAKDIDQLAELLTKDLFNLYSLSFLNKSKELSERRIRLDFGLVGEVSRIRGQLSRVDSAIFVSFENKEDCLKCLQEESLLSKYPSLSPAPAQRIVADKDGYFSIEFTNVGMSGVKEITNEFSKHGEIVKVQQSGGRNAIKKVSVSYQDLEAAVTAIQHYANSNDVRGIDFVAECLETEEGEASPGGAQ